MLEIFPRRPAQPMAKMMAVLFWWNDRHTLEVVNEAPPVGSGIGKSFPAGDRSGDLQ